MPEIASPNSNTNRDSTARRDPPTLFMLAKNLTFLAKAGKGWPNDEDCRRYEMRPAHRPS